MLTIRYANGGTVCYDADTCKYEDRVMILYNTKGKRTWIASVPYASGAVVEAEKPHKVCNLRIKVKEN